MMDHDDSDDTGGVRERIESCFRRIETERMAGIPILNRALHVEVVGLDRFGDEWMCILITPWFMNIVLLPVSSAAAAAKPPLAVGSKSIAVLPAGSFEMIHGFEEAIGCYRMCSLFSPMYEFSDHESAVAAAKAARAALLESDADPDVDADMAMIWRGERPDQRRRDIQPDAEHVQNHRVEASPAGDEHTGKPDAELSRRALFLGRAREEPGQ